MKIKVHEIDGDYYCAVDDITVAVSKATGEPRSRERCLADLIREYDVFLMYEQTLGNYYYTYDGNEKEKTFPSGFYRISEWGYECYDDECSECGYFYNHMTDKETFPLLTSLERLHLSPNTHEARPKIKIKHLSKKNTNVKSFFDNVSWQVLSDYGDFITIKNIAECYIGLVDAKIYLANVATDDDFIMPKTEPITQQAKPTAEQVAPEAQSILNDQSDYFSPYLAIAIDIWERAYIHGEIISIEKDKPSKTKDKGEPIKNIIEKHYPNLKDSWIKNIADIIKTYQGESIKKINGETD